jgi:hypothetical protein
MENNDGKTLFLAWNANGWKELGKVVDYSA